MKRSDINYEMPCRCQHMPVNHAAEIQLSRVVREACLLCDCKRYEPINRPAPETRGETT